MVHTISVLIPALNESDRLSATVRSFLQGRRSGIPVEFVIVDDGSADGCCLNFAAEAEMLSHRPGVSFRICGLARSHGNYTARNLAAAQASGDVLFITDAHVAVLPGWDELLAQAVSPGTISVATICTPSQRWSAYGCRLLYPDMSTRWNRSPPAPGAPVAVSPCSGTIISRELFCHLGGYDPGMLAYYAGEPEFSVRAWLLGADIRCLPALRVLHRFKARTEYRDYTDSVRPMMIHNAIRFAALYLNEAQVREVAGYYADRFPAQARAALGMLDRAEVSRRRSQLEASAVRSFSWFSARFPVTGLG